jgi:hypothetical protein
MFSTNLFDKIDFAGVKECFIFICIVFFSDDNTSKTRSTFSKESDDGSSVDSWDGGDTRARTPWGEGFNGCPMGVFCCVVGDDDAGALNGGRLEIAEEIVFITFVNGWNAIIAWIILEW